METSNRLYALVDRARSYAPDILKSFDDLTSAHKNLDIVLDSLEECLEIIEETKKPFAYLIKTELQDGSVAESFIKAEGMKYKYIVDACDFGYPIPLYK